MSSLLIAFLRQFAGQVKGQASLGAAHNSVICYYSRNKGWWAEHKRGEMVMKPIFAAALGAFMILAQTASAEMREARDGWFVAATDQTFADLSARLTAAVSDNGMAVVTRAGPTKAAANRGITIPGNEVVGIFNNDVAVRLLALSTAAMIEAPIRMYVTENADGTASLSYKLPSTVLSPYMDEAGEELGAIAQELDMRFEMIAEATLSQ